MICTYPSDKNFFFIGKFLVISGAGNEIVDLCNPSVNYEILNNNIPTVDGATGGLLSNSPIVCVGVKNGEVYNDCVVIGQQNTKMKMLESRVLAASIALDDRTLWIVGGWDENDQDLSTTEFIKLGQPSEKGPDMPFDIWGHSMIQFNKKSIYIIGGYQGNSKCSNKTWIVDPTDEFKMREGPSLNVGRSNHGCAKISVNGRTIIVVAGGYRDSVEILDPSTNKWTLGLLLNSISVELYTVWSILRLHFLKSIAGSPI